MKPLHDTDLALAKLASFGETKVPSLLAKLARGAVEIVPDCLGLSLDCRHSGAVFTLVATCEEVAALSAVQNVDGGPASEVMATGSVVVCDPDDVLDEGRWQLFSRLSAASGVGSSLSMPVHEDDGELVGAVTLYARSPQAFEGLHGKLADRLGADASGAVSNADLSFDSRLQAVQAESRLLEDSDVDFAAGLLSERTGQPQDSVKDQLVWAAAGAGLSQARLAQAVIDLCR